MTMRSLFAAFFLSLVALPVHAQGLSRAEAALAYTYVHTNAPPNGCGCFSMNGGSGSFAFHFTQRFAGVADFGAVHAGNVDSSGLDLTLISYLFGPRYSFHTPGTRLIPYAQVLVGAVHASGGLTPTNSSGTASSNAFAATVGGGVDLKLTHHLTIRPIQAEYFVTKLPNGVNDHQNNLHISSGLVFRF
jgi:peptidoglycan-associated lipoprotein